MLLGRWGVMIVVLLVGMTILVSNLENYEPLWVDEGWSMIVTEDPSARAVTEQVAKDVHPPFYFYMLALWRFVAGDGVFVARFLTVLITLIGATLIYRLGADLLNPFSGLLASALYVLHDLVIVLGREVRQYPLLQLLTLLTLWTYWRFNMQTTRKRGLWFVLSGGLLLWTHYWGGFVLLALALHTLIVHRRRLRPYLIAYVLIGISFVPWLPALYTQLTQNVPNGIGHALPASQLGYEVLAFQLLGRPEPLWVLLMVAGVLSIHVRRPTRHTLLLLAVVIVPVGLTVLINLEYAVLSFRTLSLVIPVTLLLVAHAISNLRRYGRILLSVIVITLSVVFIDAEPPGRLPWNTVADYVTRHSDADDAVLIETWFDAYALQYYLERRGNVAYFPTEVVARDSDDTTFASYLDTSLVPYDGVWVVRFSPLLDISPRLRERDYDLTGRVTLDNIEFLRFDRPPESEPIATFGDVLTLHDMTLIGDRDGLGVNLLWSPLVVPERDYVVSVFALDSNGVLAAQDDSRPLDTSTQTWTADDLYFDARQLSGLAAGVYTIGVRVYWFTDSSFQQTMSLPPSPCDDPCEFIILERITVVD